MKAPDEGSTSPRAAAARDDSPPPADGAGASGSAPPIIDQAEAAVRALASAGQDALQTEAQARPVTLALLALGFGFLLGRAL
jgi:hypothetical protein